MGLFGKKESPAPAVVETKPGMNSINKTVIGEGVTFVGDFVSDEEFVIRGTVKGTITSSTLVCVDEKGSHYGKLAAENVTIKGYAESDVLCKSKTTISGTGHMKGHLVSGNLQTDPGSVFDGTLKLNKQNASVKNPIDIEVEDAENLFK